MSNESHHGKRRSRLDIPSNKKLKRKSEFDQLMIHPPQESTKMLKDVLRTQKKLRKERRGQKSASPKIMRKDSFKRTRDRLSQRRTSTQDFEGVLNKVNEESKHSSGTEQADSSRSRQRSTLHISKMLSKASDEPVHSPKFYKNMAYIEKLKVSLFLNNFRNKLY